MNIKESDRLYLTPVKIRELVKFLNSNKKAEKFLKDNLYDSSVDRIDKYQINAESLVKSAESNRKSLIKNATIQELKMKLLLKELSIKYEFQKIYFTGEGYYIVDFYIPKYNVVLEIDGNQHRKSYDKKWDKLRTENLLLIHKVDRVIRFSNRELLNDTDTKKYLLLQLEV